MSPNAEQWGENWTEIGQYAREAGRDPAGLTGAVCLNLSIDEDAAAADRQLDDYLARYYGVTDATAARQSHGSYAGPAEGAAEWLTGFARAGVEHFVLRFAGSNERHLEIVAGLRAELGW